VSDIGSTPGKPSGRSQDEQRRASLLADLAKSMDVQHHNTSLMHQFGEAFEAPQTVAQLLATDLDGFTGQAESPARSDHRHGTRDLQTLMQPAGTLRYTINSAAEPGWIEIDGTTYTGAQTAFPVLWGIVPAGWKSGSSLVTPDWRNRYAISHTGGRTVGDLLGSHTSSLAVGNMPSHAHGINVFTGGESANHVHNVAGSFVNNTAGGGIYAGGIGGSLSGFTTIESAAHVHAINSATDAAGSGSAFNTFPASVDLYWKMRAF